MDAKGKIKLYKGILLGHTGNSLGAKFKLIRAIQKNGVNNLYKGLRVDNISPPHYSLGFVCNDSIDPTKIKFWSIEYARKWYGLRDSVFLYDDKEDCYYDVIDGDTKCELISDERTAEFGCCNVKKLNHYSEIAKVKILTRKGLKIK